MARNQDGKILISRTRVNEINWQALKRVASFIQQETGQVTTREDLLNMFLENLIDYYIRKKERDFREPE